MTIGKLASGTGMSICAISRIENAANMPTKKNAKKIANFFGVCFDDIFGNFYESGIEITCKMCGKEFIANWGNAKYCSACKIAKKHIYRNDCRHKPCVDTAKTSSTVFKAPKKRKSGLDADIKDMIANGYCADYGRYIADKDFPARH